MEDFTQIVVAEIHSKEKSVLSIKPDGLKMIRSQHPPNETAGLVHNSRNEALATFHLR